MLYQKLSISVLALIAVSAMASPRSSESNNRFGVRLYREAKQAESNSVKNTFVSPVSAFLALSMTVNGAVGDTERAILSTISASGMTRAELNDSNRELMGILNAGGKEFTLEVANSLWTSHAFRFRPEFASMVERNYDAVARSLDFSDPSASLTINGWVEEKTHGKIKEIVEKQLQSDFYLVNATYFKGQWTHPFDERATVSKDFHQGVVTKQVQMMHTELDAQYLRGDGFEAIRLPYGDRGGAAAIAILPSGTVEDFDSRLTAEVWEAIVRALSVTDSERVALSLPKFKFDYELDLKAPLSRMGMGIAFTPLANFLDLSPSGIVLNKALQKTYVATDEKGTEAAAATVISGVTSVPPGPKVKLVFNRPFVFSIVEEKSGALLFLGSVSDPEFK